MKYIVCKVRVGGTLVPGTPPFIHESYGSAVAEAERLMADPRNDAEAFSVFQEVAKSTRVACPVQTTDLR